MAAEAKKARRIAVISGKGGVGKSVITANLAGALSTIGHRILVIDADLGLANLDIILGLSPNHTLLDAFRGTHALDEVLLPTRRGFDLIAAGSGIPEGAQLNETMAEHVESLLSSLESKYDAVLFDAGAGIGDVVLFFAGLADEIMLVVTPEPTCMMDAYATIKVLNQLQGRREFLLVVNQIRPDRSGQVGESVAHHLQKVAARYIEGHGQQPVRIQLIGSIPSDPAVPRALLHRQLLSEACPQAPAACRMINMANFLASRL